LSAGIRFGAQIEPRTTKAGSQAFNEAFLAARRKARQAGEQMDPRDIPPVFLDNWRE
jgi:hypothetical protein